jgi:tetratricopeptide (TPR) repeat protein
MSVQLHCLPEEQANLEASIQNVTAGEQLAAFSLDGTIDDLFAFRRKLQTNLYKLLSMGAELHAEQLPDASAYRNYLRAIDGAANDDNRSKIEVLKTAIKTSDKFGPLWTQLGAAQLRLGEADFRNAEDHFAAAETSLGNALDINPTYPLTSDVLAAVYMRTGRTEEAANLVRKGIAARPKSAALRSRLTNVVSVEGQIAKALIYQGRYEDALRSYDRVRSLLAEYGRSPDEKTLFYEGLTYFYLDQRPKAVQLFDAAYVTEPDTLWSRFAIAYKYAALDNHADLVSIAKRLENDNIADGERRYRLAHFYALAGHHDEAVRHLDTALESGNFNYTYISRDPFLESIRSTKRYSEIIQRMKERHTRFQDSLTEIVRGDSE